MSSENHNEALPIETPPTRNGSSPRDSKGWDGKARVEKRKKAEVVNAEVLSDPEYSDEDAPPVEQIEADEGSRPKYELLLLLTRRVGRSAGRLPIGYRCMIFHTSFDSWSCWADWHF